MTRTANDQPDSPDCRRLREALSAAIDGEAEAGERVAALAHRADCKACDGYATWAAATNVALRELAVDASDSDRLWERISEGIDTQISRADAKPPRVPAFLGRRSSRRVAIIAAAAAALALVVGGVAVQRSASVAQPAVVAEAVNDFLTFRASGRTLDVASGTSDEIRAWLAARVTFEVPIDRSPPAGFRLVGGRLCSFLNRRLASLHYAIGPRAASLYVMEDHALSLSSTGNRRVNGQPVFVVSHKGVASLVWHGGGLVYVVVSDLTEAEVLALAESVLPRRSNRPTRASRDLQIRMGATS